MYFKINSNFSAFITSLYLHPKLFVKEFAKIIKSQSFFPTGLKLKNRENVYSLLFFLNIFINLPDSETALSSETLGK